jgi:hypothetical protein
MVPFQSDIIRSSPLSSPYEHASVTLSACMPNHVPARLVPAPCPFSPFSSSSSSRKFRGTLAPMFAVGGSVLRRQEGGLYPAIDRHARLSGALIRTVVVVEVLLW